MNLDKCRTTAIFTVVLLITSTALMTITVQAFPPMGTYTLDQLTNVQDSGGQRLPSGVTPDYEFAVIPYMSFRPNPVGIGQPILVNLWIDPGPSFVRYFTDFKVTITKPDSTTDVKTMDSYRADSTAWFEYVVDQIGIWKLKFDFPGQYFPPGNYTTPEGTSQAGWTESYTESLYYKPASTPELTLTVQENLVASWPPAPLPTDYWTRPIPAENREWWVIGGDYPWYGPSGGPTWDALYPNTDPTWTSQRHFIPWVQAPNTAHVAWKRQNTISGIIGGDQGIYTQTNGGGTPTIVFQGRGYQTLTKAMPTTVSGATRTQPVSVWECYDLRTGEVYWDLTDVTTPSYIEYGEGLPGVVGATESVRISPALVAISGNRLIKYDPATGRVTLNVSIPVFASNTYYKNGYVLSEQILSNTGGPGEPGTPTEGIYCLINWTTFESSSNFASRIVSNISWPRAELFSTTFYWGNIQDYETGISFLVREPSTWDFKNYGFPYTLVGYDNATGFRYNTRIAAYSQKTGDTLWDITVHESTYSAGASVTGHGKLVVLMRDNEDSTSGGYFMCFDELTGKLVWKSEKMDYPWDVPGFGAYSTASAYGMFIRFAYSGVYAFDWDTGKIVWKYEAPAFSPYETPYTNANGTTVYSFNSGGWIADGKLYTYNTEHTPTQPITRGWGVHCINMTTGEKIWTTKMAGSVGAIADGYLTVSGSDGYTYVYGKGKSETSVTAEPAVVAKGASVLIKGSVLDLSSAQAGTPCVSADSMTTQMEYLHNQMPIDGLWHNETITGVPVILTAIGSDGNVVDIGTTTTNGYGGTFGMAWTPAKEDTYTIMASFMADDSYGSSMATTGLSVGPAPETPSTPEITTPVDNTMTIVYAAIAIIIAVIVSVALVGALILRKR